MTWWRPQMPTRPRRLRRASRLAFAIIGLDDGEQLAAALREQGLSCPVLLLTDGEAADRARNPWPGRSAFPPCWRGCMPLTPIMPRPMTRRCGSGPIPSIPAAKLLQADGRKVRLTEKETNILKFLHASAGTVPRDILLHEVWGYGPAVATHTLETHIYRLRKKIEQDPAKAQILLTEGGGYRLSA